jgi:hypothetical protein
MSRLLSSFWFRVLVGAVIALIAIYLFLPLWDTWSEKWGNHAKFAMIQRGMTKAEVAAILGNEDFVAYSTLGNNLVWEFADGEAQVMMDSAGKVENKTWDKSKAKSPLQIIRDLLRKIGL